MAFIFTKKRIVTVSTVVKNKLNQTATWLKMPILNKHFSVTVLKWIDGRLLADLSSRELELAYRRLGRLWQKFI